MRLLCLGLLASSATAAADPERVASVDTGVRVSSGGTALQIGAGVYAWSRLALTASAFRAGYIGAVHWREPLGRTTLDLEAGYSRGELPTATVHAGAHLELALGHRGSVGLGGRVFSATAASLDSYLKIPLPAGVYIRGDVTFQHAAAVDLMETSITPPADLMDQLESSVLLGELSVGVEL